jgi:hypothetical protein
MPSGVNDFPEQPRSKKGPSFHGEGAGLFTEVNLET